MTSPSEILVVDNDVASRDGLLSVLRNLGYSATGAPDDIGGCALLGAFPFDVLITDIGVHAESGVKLIRQAREAQPEIAIIAIVGSPQVEEKEIARFEAISLRKPLDLERLSEILVKKAASCRRLRRWSRKRVAGGFGATVGDAAATIVDVSYGGFRLETSAPPDPSQSPRITMNLLPFGFAVDAHLVWINRYEPTGPWSCGAVLADLDPVIERAWRVVVDALPESASQ